MIKTQMWGVPEMRVPPNGWFIRENPIKMDDLGVPPFQETSIFVQAQSKIGDMDQNGIASAPAKLLTPASQDHYSPKETHG